MLLKPFIPNLVVIELTAKMYNEVTKQALHNKPLTAVSR